MRDAGLSVVFITNSGRLRPEAMAALQPLCAGVLVRRNIGYDFGAMREGLEYLGLPRAETEMVLLVNDSVYGPLGPLDDMLARIDFTAADLWGATESWQRRYHLQSYFVAAGRRALDSAAWRTFWSSVRPVKSKSWVISRYEVGLTQKLLRAGLRCAAIFAYRDLVPDVDVSALAVPIDSGTSIVDPLLTMRRIHAHHVRHHAVTRTPLNPTSDLWRQLLHAGFPFIKRELLRENPTQVADIVDWSDTARQQFGALPNFIERDLQRAMKNRVP
ncbi:MAG: lipopolysaccharide biosynthesis protein [Rhodospirillales bacterium]|nr:lipopolysaccharide biosynthesis protein [Rhodospirillales bacterium]MDE2198567.1 lipopolysaccharide biosynthesis protein [Rhodospirillales bacterium]MDE2575474.1 lipopolysaccharide biosynthesis protein [Rhodospirillales bacterium]